MDLEQEKVLIQKSQSDIEAFSELYDENYTKILNYALRRTANIHVAQDITSEVFIKALKNIKKYRFRGYHFSSWLYRIANNEIANHFRKNGHAKYNVFDLEKIPEITYVNTGAAENNLREVEFELQRNEEFLVLHNSISMLPNKYQEVITLRFFEDKQVKEVSEILGKREGTVKSLLHRGLKKLEPLMAQNANK